MNCVRKELDIRPRQAPDLPETQSRISRQPDRHLPPFRRRAVDELLYRLRIKHLDPLRVRLLWSFAQVKLLQERLQDGVAIGTVDKFQGQQAPVVFFSMATSSGADAPRGIDFLMSRNRLNVAVSRAQCLAYLACAPTLLDVDVRTIEHMRLANALCRFVELAA